MGQAPTGGDGELVVLRDGSQVLVRPIRPDDKWLLRRGLDRLGPDSRYRRFLAPKKRLTDQELVYLTEVDHHDHEALVAVSADGSEPVGVARYVRLQDAPAAEVAVVVVDHSQGRGVGTALLERLVRRARATGVERFTATCLASNNQVLELLEDLGPARVRRTNGELVEVDIELEPEHAQAPLRHILRGAAAGDLEVLRSARTPARLRSPGG